MRKVVVTGGSGQLAQAIKHIAKGCNVEVYAPTHAECDITDAESVHRVICGADIVVNAAAYTNVDGAERNGEEAYRINCLGAAIVARTAAECGITAIQISTDYVFGKDSNRHTPYEEDAYTAPINRYGATKCEGEAEALRHNAIVIRTSWLYSPWGKNFCRTILSLARTQSVLRVVDDQRGTPTSALSLARAIIQIVESGQYSSMSGIYHFCDKGEASWYDFAREIVARSGITTCDVVACSSLEQQREAARPRYSRLAIERISHIEGISITEWQSALDEVLMIITKQDDI
ncbi:MAG: dTDP-4-dehydrorhamnose reductase [Alistipes sp.]|nr:dTDP-4-dehydrorhamnose reductase [Alistipes sp.]